MFSIEADHSAANEEYFTFNNNNRSASRLGVEPQRSSLLVSSSNGPALPRASFLRSRFCLFFSPVFFFIVCLVLFRFTSRHWQTAEKNLFVLHLGVQTTLSVTALF